MAREEQLRISIKRGEIEGDFEQLLSKIAVGRAKMVLDLEAAGNIGGAKGLFEIPDLSVLKSQAEEIARIISGIKITIDTSAVTKAINDVKTLQAELRTLPQSQLSSFREAQFGRLQGPDLSGRLRESYDLQSARRQLQFQKTQREFFDNVGLDELFASATGGQARRFQLVQERAARLEEQRAQPGLAQRLLSGVTAENLSDRTPLFSTSRLKGGALTQIALGGVFGGPAGLAAGLVGGLAGGAPGALAAGALQQAAGGLIEPILGAFKSKEEEFKEAGLAYQRSVLGITSVLQNTTQVLNAQGVPLGGQNIGAQIRFQEQQAAAIQNAARARLLPLGIGGAQEGTFVQGTIAALGTRGIDLSGAGAPGRVANISESLGGLIKAVRPQLLENPTLANRDIQDFLSGGPQARRTLLGSIGREALPELGRATNLEDIENALKRFQSFSQTVRGSENIQALLGRQEGAQQNLATVGGNAFFEAIKPGVKSFTEALQTEDVTDAAKTLGTALGGIAKTSLDFSAAVTKAAAAMTTFLKPLIDFTGEATRFAPAMLTAAAALGTVKIAAAGIGAGSIKGALVGGAAAAAGGNFLDTYGQEAAGKIQSKATSALEQRAGGLFAGGASNLLSGGALAVGSRLGLLGLAGAAGFTVTQQVQQALDQREADKLEQQDAQRQAIIDSLQAGSARANVQNQTKAALGGVGIDLDTIAAAQQKTEANRLLVLNQQFAAEQAAAGRTPGGASKLDLDRQFLFQSQISEQIPKAFEEQTAFLGTFEEGKAAKLGLFGRGAGLASTEAAQGAAFALQAKYNQARTEEGTPEEQLSRLSIARDEARTAFNQAKRSEAQRALGLRTAQLTGGLDFLNPFRNPLEPSREEQAQNALLAAQAESAKARTGLQGAEAALKAGPTDKAGEIANQLIAAEQKILETKEKEIQAQTEIAKIADRQAETLKGAFVTSTERGAREQFGREATFRERAIEANRAAIPRVREELEEAQRQQGLNAVRISEAKSPQDKAIFEKQQDVLDATVRALEERQQNIPVELRRGQIQRFEAQLAGRNANLATFGEQEAGLNRETFGGEIGFARLEQGRALQGAGNIRAQIAATQNELATNKGLTGDERKTLEDLIRSKGFEAQNLDVQGIQRGQQAIQGQFGQAQGIAQLGNLAIDLSHIFETEIQKRQEVNDALDASRNALEAFSTSAKQRADEFNTNIIAQARKVKEEGGSIPVGLDLSDQALKAAQVQQDTSRLNQLLQQGGFAPTATAPGLAFNQFTGGSPFQQGLNREENQLQGAFLTAQINAQKFPNEQVLRGAGLAQQFQGLGYKLGGQGINAGATALSQFNPPSFGFTSAFSPQFGDFGDVTANITPSAQLGSGLSGKTQAVANKDALQAAQKVGTDQGSKLDEVKTAIDALKTGIVVVLDSKSVPAIQAGVSQGINGP